MSHLSIWAYRSFDEKKLDRFSIGVWGSEKLSEKFVAGELFFTELFDELWVSVESLRD